ncbi:MAG: ABC transporter permease [Pseudomonadota bacterium]|nr:MAG: ABC transporter permease [Pseudomonadota bacterium]
MVNGLAARAAARHFARHPWQLVLTIIGVALGVAVMVSVDITNEAAARAFALSSDTVVGKATHQIIGGPTGLDERLYLRLRTELGMRAAAPVIEGFGTANSETLHLLGVDPFAESGVRNELAGVARAATTRLLTEPSTVVLADVTAERLGLASNDSFRFALGTRSAQVTVAAIIATDAGNRARLDGLVIADIATAQELLGTAGRISWIDLVVPEGIEGETLLTRIRAILPATAELVPAASRAQTMAQMTRAFRINLTAMSLLALLVGMFLIFNTMTFAVLQRRRLFGLLRALGLTRDQLFVLVVREGLVIGVLGTTFGLLAGIALAHGLIGLVARTINDLYFVVSVTELAIAPAPLIKGALLGIAGTLLAMLVPAREAAVTPPQQTATRSLLETRAHYGAPRLALAGGGLLLAALVLLAYSSRDLLVAFAGVFLVIIGLTLMAPMVVHGVTRAPAAIVGRWTGPTGRLALRGIDASLSRTGVAIAALMLAVATTIGVGIMIASFRASVADWLDTTLRADLFVGVPSLKSTRNPAHLDPDFTARVRSLPGIGSVTSVRYVVVETHGRLDELMVLDAPRDFGERFTILQGDPEAALNDFFAGSAILVTEPYAYHRGVAVGDSLVLRTERGPTAFRIAGIFRDYATEHGQLVMIRSLYDAHYADPHVTTLGIWLAPSASIADVTAAVRAAVPAGMEVVVRANRELRALSLAIFDRTFTITTVLRGLAVIAAVIGILSALMALALERARELGVLRAVGFTPGQMRALVLTQSGAMGLIAGALAIPMGVVLAHLLIDVINRRAFGWSMDIQLSATVMLEGVVLAVLAALLAGIYPALKMARAVPAESLREE